ncbi:MAG: glycerophosphoryl diester phosphodiesterase [Alphaproteobacteria bacterium]|nr:glycerophosphoryl diester phosphodiesterase [Alphaproteobacteria bacterium]
MTLKLPKIIGHRGCAAYAPENTLEGLHMAADMGVEWVEFDVKLTKDQVPILFHDDTLDRTTDTTGLVAEMLYEDIRELDAGLWFGESFMGARIPTLEEAVDVLIERDLGVNLEIKPCPGREKETAEVVLDVLSGIWDEHDKLLLSSFAWPCLEVALEMAEDWFRGFLLPGGDEWAENWAEMATYFRASTLHFNGNTASAEQIRSLLALEKPLLAYTINDAEHARALQRLGVDGFFTDAPDVLQDGIFSVH